MYLDGWGPGVRGLRLDDVTIAGSSLPDPLNFEVSIAEIRSLIVPAWRNDAVSDVSRRLRVVSDVLVGLKAPHSGQVFVDGSPVSSAHHRTRRHGVRLVPSNGGLLPNLKVLENVLYTECVVRRRPRRDLEKEVRHSSAVEYGLGDVLDRYPHQITLGRRRMAGVARAMRAHPSVLVLEDDPETPTWTALLGVAGHSESDYPAGPLAGVATVLVTSDAARAPGIRDADD